MTVSSGVEAGIGRSESHHPLIALLDLPFLLQIA
jgi:hypothetical protein